MKNIFEFAEDLREKVDIVEFLSQYLNIKKRGKNYVALCPFHPDKNPSLNISREKGLFHCFGCGVGGTIYHFVMKMENVSFERAVEIVANWANVEIPSFEYSKKNDWVYSFHEKLANYFKENLLKNENIVDYLFKRGLDLNGIEKFCLGYAPIEIDDFLKKENVSDAKLRETGIYPYRNFSKRLIFPIKSVSGKIVGFSGRALEGEEPKYINSQETIFKKGEILYGLYENKDEILKTKEAILVEGYMDVIILNIKGIRNVVSSMGTSFTEDQGKILKRFADRLYISFDPDIGGVEGTKRALEIGEKYNFEVKVIEIPDKLDPDEFVLKYGRDEFLNLIKNSLDAINFLWNEAEKKNKGSETLVPLVKDLIEIAKRIKDPTKRFDILKRISERTGFPETILLEEIKEKKVKKSQIIEIQDNILEREFLTYIIKNREFLDLIKDEINENYIMTKKYKDLYIKIKNSSEFILMEDALYRELLFSDIEIGPKEHFFDIIKRLKFIYLQNQKKELLINLEKAEKEKKDELIDYFKLKLIELEKEIKNLRYKEV
ncbi:MAG: DNA primase [Caldisericia bacterium]|jgi:DNA primase|nr:DNA primase [Caldisericia bacterium]